MDRPVTLYLSPNGLWNACPTWWKNVITHLEHTGALETPNTAQAIADYFARTYQAQYLAHSERKDYYQPGCVVFPSQQAAQACLLAWA